MQTNQNSSHLSKNICAKFYNKSCDTNRGTWSEFLREVICSEKCVCHNFSQKPTRPPAWPPDRLAQPSSGKHLWQPMWQIGEHMQAQRHKTNPNTRRGHSFSTWREKHRRIRLVTRNTNHGLFACRPGSHDGLHYRNRGGGRGSDPPSFNWEPS